MFFEKLKFSKNISHKRRCLISSFLNLILFDILVGAMDGKEYKKYHEEHMINNLGTSFEECGLLISTIPFCIFLSSYLSFYTSKGINFITEFFIVVLPVILNCTILSDINHIIFFNIVLLNVIIVVLKTDVNSVKNIIYNKIDDKKSFITNYRASTNFISAVCILAVDFMVFPKRLAKTESFGWGFMDLGAGFFICSNGFVEKHRVSHANFVKLLKTEFALCTFGLIRVLSVKSLDYHEHVSEYGVHWNFFFTLAFCRFLSYVIIFFTNNASLFYLSITTGFLHQMLLLNGLQEWIFSDAPRDSFLSANREGLVSGLGYVSLYFAASAIGKYILHLKNLTYKKLLIKLFVICIFTWIGTVISFKTFGVSRRLVNLGYIFWILSLSTTELVLLVTLEISLLCLKKEEKTDVFLTVPYILESINAYGLLFFLLSNLLTGLINLIFQTLLLGKIMNMAIIIGYMLILCSITYALFLKKFHFKSTIVESVKK